MSQNILIFVVDQLNGTLFLVGPADWRYVPNLKRLAARSTRFNRGLYRLAALRTGAGTGSVGGDGVRSRGHLCADCQPVFGLETDPHERNNLASHPQHKKVVHDLRDQSHAQWDLDQFDAEVRESQAQRSVVYEALREGCIPLGLLTAAKSLRALCAEPYGSQHAQGPKTGSHKAP